MDITTAVRKLTAYMIVEDPERVANAYDAVTLTRDEITETELDSWDDETINTEDREVTRLVIRASSADILKALQSL